MDRIIKTYHPSPRIWLSFYPRTFFATLAGALALFSDEEISVRLTGLFFLLLGIFDVVWRIAIATGRVMKLELTQRGIDYRSLSLTGFFRNRTDFFSHWSNIRRVDIRMTGYGLFFMVEKCVVIEEHGSAKKPIPLWYFKEKDINELFRFIGSKNPRVSFTESALDLMKKRR